MTGTTVGSSRPEVGHGARGLALLLGLVTIVAMLAAPVQADSHQIVSPGPNAVVHDSLTLEAHATPGVAVNYAVRQTEATDDDCKVSTDIDGIERDVEGGTTVGEDGTWARTIDLDAIEDLDAGPYCFAFHPDDAERISVRFWINEPRITAPSPDGGFGVTDTLTLTAQGAPDTPVNYAVRTTAADDDRCSVSYDRDGIARDIGGGTSTESDGSWTQEIELGELADLEPGLYCFAFHPEDAPRVTVTFRIDDVDVLGELIEDDDGEDEPSEGDDGEDEPSESCYPDDCVAETTSSDGQTFHVRTTAEPKDGESASLSLSLPDTDEGTVGGAVSSACEALLADTERLGGAVAHLVPSGFAEGNLIVTMEIPREVIEQGESRGTSQFQVCVAPTADEADAYPDRYGDLGAFSDDAPGLVGPILLDDCTSATDTACVESRQRIDDAELIVTFRLPTADPYFR